jgi:sugar (pentulose or hexulose) kinase
MNHLLGIDIGTSSLKAVLYNRNLVPVAQARHEYSTTYPAPDQAEQDPMDWLAALKAAVRSLLDQAAVPATSIAAVGVAGMSSLALPVAADGTPLRRAMIWLDRRSSAESAWIEREHGDRQVAINGNRSDPSNFAPKVMWIRDHEPEVYAAADAFLHTNAFIVRQLTGVSCLDASQSGLSQICRLDDGEYAPELVEAYGIDPRKLPRVAECADVVGRVTAAGAALSGLAEGTPVVAGAMDNVAATMGCRLSQPGDAYVSAGTVTNVGVLLDRPVYDGRGLIYQAGRPGRWLVNGGVDFGGAGLLWFRDILEERDFSGLGALAAETRCGETGLFFLPYMVGQRAPFWNGDTRGVVLGLTPATERRHLVRMFMEGTAFGARHAFDTLNGSRPRRAMLTGGITQNPVWRKLFAEVTGMTLTVPPEIETTTLGAAILAGIGAGVFTDPEDAFARLPVPGAFTPDPAAVAYYDEMFGIFLEAYAGLSGVFTRLSRLRPPAEVA